MATDNLTSQCTRPMIPIRDVDGSAFAEFVHVARLRGPIRISSSVVAAALTLLVYAIVRGAERTFVWFVQPSRFEVHLISQTILLVALGGAIYLWLSLRGTRATLTALEREHVVLDTELSLAREIQLHLLPEIPSYGSHGRWAARIEPAGRIGGDFYDFIPLDDGFLVVVGDVSGKGIPAALLQTSAHALFRTLARDTADPAGLLEHVSREIHAENGGTRYLTCLVMRFHRGTASLTYANAGHPAGLLLRSSGRRLLDAGGPPVGLFADSRYEIERVSLTPGDLGVLVTDGITEAIEQDGVTAADRLAACVGAVPAPRTPDRVCDALMGLARYGGGPVGVSGWQDDKTVLAFVVTSDLEAGRIADPS